MSLGRRILLSELLRCRDIKAKHSICSLLLVVAGGEHVFIQVSDTADIMEAKPDVGG